ncbi:hypothetical protein ACFL1N_10430 [Thermodesulfobacteriota bacterium]
MPSSDRKIIMRDSTLREGLDTPTVSFTMEQKKEITELLDNAGVAEIEAVAPGYFLRDIEFVKTILDKGLRSKTTGLIYSHGDICREEIDEGARYLDRFDLLMPVSPKRKPYDRDEKIRILLEALEYSLDKHPEVGVGFPHSTQVETGFLSEIGQKAVEKGAKRVTVYDTNGSRDPFEIHSLITGLREGLSCPLFFHGHNDLGMATANSLSAIIAGADGLDLTINGLGDRAGNGSLEQIVMCLHLKGYKTGVSLDELIPLSKSIEKMSGIAVSKLAPVTGEFIFVHKSPAHLEIPELFMAFDPRSINLE